MSKVAVARSSFLTSLDRYRASWGLWVLLLIAPVGARFMVAQEDGKGLQVAVGGHLPVMTSATLGVTLGIIVSTLLLPIGFIYLRSNVTRTQPWQIEEVAPASRVAISLGRFGADVAVLFLVLTALTVAGWLLSWQAGTGPMNLWHITVTLWIVAAPSMMGLAALRILADSFQVTRRGLGETLFFLLWMTALVLPAALSALPSSFAVNMLDFTGFLRPLTGPTATGTSGITIGISTAQVGRVPVDVMTWLNSPGYLASRLTWALIAVALTVFAGCFYRPHSARARARGKGRIARLFGARAPAPAKLNSPPAPGASVPFIGLVAAEFRLIGRGRTFVMLAAGAALLGLIGDFRDVGSPSALLVLAFGLAAHAGRSEARGLIGLAGTLPFSPPVRRSAFVLAGTVWSLLMALPAAMFHMSTQPLLLSMVTGLAASLVACGLAAISRSAFAPRLVLFIMWYGYFTS